MNVAQETLGLRRAGFSPALTLLMSAFALLISPGNLTIPLRRRTERSPTIHGLRHGSAASADSLSPVKSSAQDDSISELLRFL
jgi:hypothetical protein